MINPITEFSLIDRYFKRKTVNRNITESIGDECALLTLPQGFELLITADTMVENVHFFAVVNPLILVAN